MDQNIISVEGLFEISNSSYQSHILYIGKYNKHLKSYVEKSGNYSYYFYNTPLKYVQLYLDGVIIAKHLYDNKNIEHFNEEFENELFELKEIKKKLCKFRLSNEHKTTY
mgnify:CR=1 FL=1